ncbi:hypothetical protein SRABI96_00570 [Peribacillus sp. Bi96]|nr:hypothetical protein SRABI96_00570 [Peribacillus sp. Bi96]
MMRAVQIQSYSKKLEARINDVPIPRINKHQVLIKTMWRVLTSMRYVDIHLYNHNFSYYRVMSLFLLTSIFILLR